MSITIQALSHRFDDEPVLCDIDLSIESGEIVAVLGPSGGGKSTLLRLIAGLEQLQSGALNVNDVLIADDTTHTPPEQRHMSLVFQEHVLFPHLNVAANVEFGLAKISPGERRAISDALLSRVGVQELASRFPETLSGGQQQRVALARALAVEPSVLLLDEPFANVDISLRRVLREDARTTLKEQGVTAVLVTHDPVEAMVMADRIACLVAGEIVQVDTPQGLWDSPAHPFVAEAIRDAQVISGRSEDGKVVTGFGPVELPAPASACSVCIYPNAVQIHAGTDAEVRDVRFLKGEYVVTLVSGDERINVGCGSDCQHKPGDLVTLSFTRDGVSVYP